LQGLVLLLLLACRSEPLVEYRHPFGFNLSLDESFYMTTLAVSDSTGSVLFLRGQEAGEPRLRVRVIPRVESIDRVLEKMADEYAQQRRLRRETRRRRTAVNSRGLGTSVSFLPFPEEDPDFEFCVDLRVFPHGERYFCFHWRVAADSTEWQRRYERWLEDLIFLN